MGYICPKAIKKWVTRRLSSTEVRASTLRPLLIRRNQGMKRRDFVGGLAAAAGVAACSSEQSDCETGAGAPAEESGRAWLAEFRATQEEQPASAMAQIGERCIGPITDPDALSPALATV